MSEPEPRPGHNEGIREIGRRAAMNGLPKSAIDDADPELWPGHDKALWRAGWAEGWRARQRLTLVPSSEHER